MNKLMVAVVAGAMALGVQAETTRVPEMKLSDIVATGATIDMTAKVQTFGENVDLAGDLSVTEPGAYSITATPKEGFTWEDGTADPVSYAFRVHASAPTDYRGTDGFLSVMRKHPLRIYNAPAKGGDIILRLPIEGRDDMYDYVHIFTNTTDGGSFTLTEDVNARFLLIGGGGSGGGGGCGTGGGGAGGFVERSVALAAGEYAVAVGAGGASPNDSWHDVRMSGKSSTFASGEVVLVEALGGGGGGISFSKTGLGGGSGGGGYNNNASGRGTAGQGFSGGLAKSGFGAGGGGAGGMGEQTGGPGRASDITGSWIYYAGGGGGGPVNYNDGTRSGGVGGGASSGRRAAPQHGTDGLGAGGGGVAEQNGASQPGGPGGSGIVIVRYRSSLLAYVVDTPHPADDLVWNGQVQTGVAEGTGYTITGNTASEAGTHTATLTLTGKYTWLDGSTEPMDIEWSIARLPILVPQPTRSDLVETGDVLVPTLNDEAGVVKAGDVDRTAVGSYVLKVTPDSNHCWKDGTLTEYDYAFRIIPTAPTNYAGTFLDHFAAHEARISKAPCVGGDIILKLPHGDEDGVFEYIHMFTTTGSATFTADEAMDVRVMVIGGGGAGGGGGCGTGGGGAGGFVERSVSLAAGEYAVAVGRGGTCSNGGQPVAGGNSSFAAGVDGLDIVALAGGGGGVQSSTAGRSGGSGGGVHRYGSSSGLGTAGQGYNGGVRDAEHGAGGGGAGGMGGKCSNASGGCGRASDILGEWVWFAGGGAGGYSVHGTSRSGGMGGGGSSPCRAEPGKGANGLGGGGGGVADQNGGSRDGSNGGSGLVVVRYTSSRVVKQIAKVPAAIEGLVWNGGEQKGVDIGAGYVITGNMAKDAGNYTATLELVDGYEWEDGSKDAKTVGYSIARAPLVRLPRPLQVAFLSTGSEIRPTLSEKNYYTISGDYGMVEPGEYTYVVEPDSNHTWPDGTTTPSNYAYRIVQRVDSDYVGSNFLGHLAASELLKPDAKTPCTGGDLIFETGRGANREVIHIFTNVTESATFTVVGTQRVRILAIGGGGAGGNASSSGGGGGAGGFVETNGVELTRGTYTVTVGAGGALGSNANGQNTSLVKDRGEKTIVEALGGGAGGSSSNGKSGGSGGGASNTSGYLGGIGSQGCDGGVTFGDGAGAGGGAGGEGQNSSWGCENSKIACGGFGRPSDITGEMIYYAGGGGGGTQENTQQSSTGGLGGGGNSPQTRDRDADPGVNGLGGGGGGGGRSGNGHHAKGGAGGSGILIIRYHPVNGGAVLIVK